MLERLHALGLSAEESEAYLSLLESGGDYAGKLAKRIKRRRTSVYHTLQKLQERGLARRTKRGSFDFYLPESPEQLVSLSKLQYDSALLLLPELLSLQQKGDFKPQAKFLEGRKGVEEVFQNTLSAKEEILGLTNLTLLIETFPDFFRRYTADRIKRGIRVRYICPRPQKGAEIVSEFFESERQQRLLEIVFVNPSQYPFQNEIAIYDNWVAILSLPKREQYALLIESQSAAATMKAFFDLAWLGTTSFMAA